MNPTKTNPNAAHKMTNPEVDTWNANSGKITREIRKLYYCYIKRTYSFVIKYSQNYLIILNIFNHDNTYSRSYTDASQ